MSYIGKRLKIILKEKDTTQRQLAENIGIHSHTINKLVINENLPLAIDYLIKIADELDISLDYLCCRDKFLSNDYKYSKEDYDLLLNFNNLDDDYKKLYIDLINHNISPTILNNCLNDIDKMEDLTEDELKVLFLYRNLNTQGKNYIKETLENAQQVSKYKKSSSNTEEKIA